MDFRNYNVPLTHICKVENEIITKKDYYIHNPFINYKTQNSIQYGIQNIKFINAKNIKNIILEIGGCVINKIVKIDLEMDAYKNIYNNILNCVLTNKNKIINDDITSHILSFLSGYDESFQTQLRMLNKKYHEENINICKMLINNNFIPRPKYHDVKFVFDFYDNSIQNNIIIKYDVVSFDGMAPIYFNFMQLFKYGEYINTKNIYSYFSNLSCSRNFICIIKTSLHFKKYNSLFKENIKCEKKEIKNDAVLWTYLEETILNNSITFVEPSDEIFITVYFQHVLILHSGMAGLRYFSHI